MGNAIDDPALFDPASGWTLSRTELDRARVVVVVASPPTLALRIEDEDEERRVVERMLAAGVPIRDLAE